jgi:hypothetical protein
MSTLVKTPVVTLHPWPPPLAQVPNLAAAPLGTRSTKRIISKAFHRIMETHGRQVSGC